MTHEIVARFLLGESPAIRALRSLVAKVARTNLSVLIQGPTGSGKELVAQALHAASGRRGQMVAFNVCAIPENMFEDALFGHVRGAFTGAMRDTPGYLAEANGGTVFFDEIGGLPHSLQSKLLRALETQEFRPVGANSNRKSEFRVVSATNEPLADIERASRLRPDLIYRLSALRVEVPALRTRLEDVPILAKHFALRATGRDGTMVSLSTAGLRALQDHDWPGNVRELKNMIETLIALSEGCEIDRQHVVEQLASRASSVPVEDAEQAESRQALLELLRAHGDDTALVAAHLGVDRATIYRRMQQLGIPTPKRSGTRRGEDSLSSALM
jgi:DNA-binding NtrC family response regulator